MKETGKEGVRLESSYVQVIEGTPDEVFPLLCPVREGEWVDGWRGRSVFSRSGVAEPDGVFATSHDGDPSDVIWVVTRRDSAAHEIEFVTFVPGRQVFRLSIAVRPRGARQSEVSIAYVRTGITEDGNTALEDARRRKGDEAMMREWEQDMNHYLVTGRCRPHGSPGAGHEAGERTT